MMSIFVKFLFLQLLVLMFFEYAIETCHAQTRHTFVVKEVLYTRLCSTKNILTVNGEFPGPTLYVNQGDTIFVDVYNMGRYNITIHWHGVNQPRNPWSDGPEYITQCPIKPGGKFSQKIIFSTEEGTLWWHAHSKWSRATVHGAIIVYPKFGVQYPFPKPQAEVPIILGQWWKQNIVDVYNEFVESGGDSNISDAFTINGQPGDLYPCSKPGTFELGVDYGKTYLLRLINTALMDTLFFAIAKHNLTVVATDGGYTKPFTTDYVTISPGQTIDALFHTNQPQDHYYMAARAYFSVSGLNFDNTTSTAIVRYSGNYAPSPVHFPATLPRHNDTKSSVGFVKALRSLADQNHPVQVPETLTTQMLIAISINTLPCANSSCKGPGGTRLSASLNNISFEIPTTTSILNAYYNYYNSNSNSSNGVYGVEFPDVPPLAFDYTSEGLPVAWRTASRRTEAKVIEFGSTVEIVLQGTKVLGGNDHPLHIHGQSFYVVGLGFGNFDKRKDTLGFNLVDPPLQNTITVPKNGWAAIRFKADNPGVWFMHCHVERHLSWGMAMAFIVKDGHLPEQHLLPPPEDMPPC